MIYFDNNATTPLAPEVIDAVRPVLETTFGNPSSSHLAGRMARIAVDRARASVAELLGAVPHEIVFTSGGTESDNWAIRGALEADPTRRHIVTTRVEHEAVRTLCEELASEGFEISWLDVDSKGALDLEQVRRLVHEGTAVVSVMLANNETGVIFPVDAVGEIVRERSNALFHVDGVNAVGKMPVDLSSGLIDLFSLSAHKFHGPKGIGALYIRGGVELPRLLTGGGQERGLRSGTEAVHQLVGLGTAAEVVRDLSAMERVRSLRDRLENELLSTVDGASVNGGRERRLPNTANISFENLNGEAILARLDDAGICVSTGSACHAADHKASAVLQAMNIPFTAAMGSIRFSLSRYNTDEEVVTVVAEVQRIVGEQRKLHGG